MSARGSRHGREMRAEDLVRLGQVPRASFKHVVAETCRFLKDEWPEELRGLRWRILDLPEDTADGQLPRWSVEPSKMAITLYRVPIQRQTHVRRPDALDERFHIEQFVFMAVGELLGKDPWDLMPDRFKN